MFGRLASHLCSRSHGSHTDSRHPSGEAKFAGLRFLVDIIDNDNWVREIEIPLENISEIERNRGAQIYSWKYVLNRAGIEEWLQFKKSLPRRPDDRVRDPHPTRLTLQGHVKHSLLFEFLSNLMLCSVKICLARFALIPEATPDMSFHFSHSSSDTSSQPLVVAPTSASMAPSLANTAVIGVSDIANLFRWCERGSHLFQKWTLTAYVGSSFQSYSRTLR